MDDLFIDVLKAYSNKLFQDTQIAQQSSDMISLNIIGYKMDALQDIINMIKEEQKKANERC